MHSSAGVRPPAAKYAPHIFVIALFLSLSSVAENTVSPVTTQPWQEVVVSVGALDGTARFFLELGGYEVKWRGETNPSELGFYDLDASARGESILLGPPGITRGLIRLIRFSEAGPQEPMRPGAHAWDTGCYFSPMIRMKDIEGIYSKALDLGWWTETPIAPLKFGASELRIVIFKGPHGIQVQGYERLSPPLPAAIPDFDAMTAPFNVMQMVRNRDTAYEFFTSQLGFDTFYFGEPYVAPEPAPMPLGIPLNITTSSRYRAGIVYPVTGEFGRMEMIELMDLKGFDHKARCHAPNYGILAVRFPVEDIDKAEQTLTNRGVPLSASIRNLAVSPYGNWQVFAIQSPNGARIEFYQTPAKAGIQ